MRHSTVWIALLSTAGIGIAMPVHAQDQDSAMTESPAADDSAANTEDIIVTAQRREQRLSKVPASIAAFTQERLDVIGARDFTDIARFTPGVFIRDQQNQISIRGLASNAGAATTGVYIDDVPIMVRTFGEGAAAALPFLFDLDRVEILRGPQGVLFGAGSLGGTVRYITPTPSTTMTEVYARAQASVTQSGAPSYEAGVAIGIPIVEDIAAARLSGAYSRQGGWVDRISYSNRSLIDKNVNSRENIVLRGSLALTPTDSLTITPSIMWQRRNTGDLDFFYPFYSDSDRGIFQQANTQPIPDKDRFTLGAVTARYDSDAISLISTSSLFWRDQQRFYDGTLYELAGYEFPQGQLLGPAGPNEAAIGLANFVVTGQIDNSQRNFTQELRLQSNDETSWLQWLVGGFYSNNRQRNIETYLEPQFDQFLKALYGPTAGVIEFYGLPLAPNGASYIGNQYQRERQIAFFGNLTVKPTDKLTVQAGLRWSEIRFDYAVAESLTPYYLAPASGAQTERPLTPRFNISYQANPNLMLYATGSKGYRSGGINGPVGTVCQNNLRAAGQPIPPRGFGSDNAWNYEVGAKGSAGPIRFDASAFYITWKNIQQRVTLSPCDVTYTLNLGEAKSTGFDMSLTAQPTPGVTLDLALGYVDTRYTKDVFLTQVATSGPRRIAAGNAVAFAGTPWQISSAVRFDFDVGPRQAFVRLQADYGSRYNRLFPSLDQNTNQFSPLNLAQPEYWNVRARAGMTFGELEAQIFVDNLLNDRTNFDQFRIGTLSQFRVQRPRTAGITLLYRQ